MLVHVWLAHVTGPGQKEVKSLNNLNVSLFIKSVQRIGQLLVTDSPNYRVVLP